MALSKEAIIRGAASEAKGILTAAPGVAADLAAQYVKQGTPSGLIPNVGVALARQACRRHAQQPNLAPDGISAGLERICRPYLDDIGYGAGPVLDLPFRGGQCPVFYNIVANGTYFAGPWNVELNGIRGPIGAPFGDNAGFGGSALQPGYTFENWNIIDGNGTKQILFGSSAGSKLGGFSVTPSAGGADTCGNPPTTVIPPTTPPGPVINIEPIIIVPFVDIDAGLTINVDGTIDVTVDGIEVNIDLSPEGGGDPGGGGGGGDPGDPTDPGNPGSPVGTGGGGSADGEAPPGTELVGLLVTVVSAPGDANRFDNNPAQPYRGIGYVRMGFSNRLGLDISGGTVISPQFFHAQQRGLTNWAVAANIGFNLTIVPYYRSLSDE